MGYNPILCDLKSLLVPKHSSCFAIFFIMEMFCVFYVLGLDSCVVASESVFQSPKMS
jgi:hypothetical protein